MMTEAQRRANKKYYYKSKQDAKNKGLCSYCKKIPVEGKFVQCADCRSKRRIIFNLWRIKNPEKSKYIKENSRITIKYSISKKEYIELLNSQSNLCAICSNIMDIPQLDHDHKTGLIRGFLCFSCNILLGASKDDIKILENAIEYLRKTL